VVKQFGRRVGVVRVGRTFQIEQITKRLGACVVSLTGRGLSHPSTHKFRVVTALDLRFSFGPFHECTTVCVCAVGARVLIHRLRLVTIEYPEQVVSWCLNVAE
jgi:hypothetical protein